MTRSPRCQRPGERRAPRRFVAAVTAPAIVVLAVVGLVVGVVPLPTVLSGGLPLGGVAVPAACAAPAADGSITVAVAVDPGGVAGMSGAPETTCVTVPADATGADVLAARARALGRPLPRYASSGLLCAIDGQPAAGCGERVDGAYRYWAYFLGSDDLPGSDGWTYAGTGPALRGASAGQVEGWRFVAGTGNPSDPPPRTSASAASLCASSSAPLPTGAPLPAPDPGAGEGTGPGDEVAGSPVVDTSASSTGPPLGVLAVVALVAALAAGATLQARRRGTS